MPLGQILLKGIIPGRLEMIRSSFILTVLAFLLVMMGAGIEVNAQGLNTNKETSSQDEIVTVKERTSGVSLSDYAGCINFCQLKLPGMDLQQICMEGCRHIDSSFQGKGGFLGLVPPE